MKFRLVLFTLLCAFLCTPLTALAELPEQIENDFAPVRGTIVMPVGENYLVDLDASSGLREGDILSLVAAGEDVIHPETKEILGTTENVRGYLQVTEVKSGYSYAAVIHAEKTPEKGDKVKRFAQVPAIIRQSGNDQNISAELKLALPHLQWLNDDSQIEPLLNFTLTEVELSVVNHEGAGLASYPVVDGKLSSSSAPVIVNDTFSRSVAAQRQNKKLLDKAFDSVLKTVGLGGRDKRLENPGIVTSQMQDSGIWTGSDLNGNPTGIAVADFDRDGLLEIAVALEQNLKVFRYVDGNLQPAGAVDFPGGIRLLSLDTVDTNGDAIPELIASASTGTRISSQIIEYQQGNYRRTITNIPWLLSSDKRQGTSHLLIGQSLKVDGESLDPRKFRVIRHDDKLIKGQAVNFPLPTDIFSLTAFQTEDGQKLYAGITADDTLQIATARGTTLWESETYYGGSETGFTYSTSNRNQMDLQYFIQKRLISLPNGGVLVPQNLGQRILERYRNFGTSRVVAMEWDGFTLQERWRTVEQDGYLADFAYADGDNDGEQELVMAINYKQKNMIQSGRSAIVISELTK